MCNSPAATRVPAKVSARDVGSRRLVFVIKLNATERIVGRDRAWVETTHHIPCASHPQLADIYLPKTPIDAVASLHCSVELIDGSVTAWTGTLPNTCPSPNSTISRSSGALALQLRYASDTSPGI